LGSVLFYLAFRKARSKPWLKRAVFRRLWHRRFWWVDVTDAQFVSEDDPLGLAFRWLPRADDGADITLPMI
jgi:hypothetical protein